ncbi:MAG: hemolysin family protein [Acetobacteraceae bacterium]
MAVLLEILFVLFLIVINGLFAMSELALVSARRARLAVLVRNGVPGAVLARRLIEEPQSYLPTVQVGITLVGILTGVYGGAQIAEEAAHWLETFPPVRPVAAPLAFAVVVVLITYFTLVIGELVPKQLALRRPEAISARVATPIAFLARLATPAVWLLGASTTLVLHVLHSPRAPAPPVSEEELKALVAEGQQAGVLEVEERRMIERVLRLADKKVRAIMTPRTEVAWLDRSDPPAELKAMLKASPHSRFVVGDGSVDNVVGVVLAKELLNRLIDGQALALTPMLHQPVVVPDTVSALDAMELLRADALGLALVMDEYGSFEGVVTAADVLVAIVGDATGAAPTPDAGQPAAEGALVFDGLMPIDELKARLVLPDLPAAGSYNTLGGLVLALLRRVPRVGDRIVFGGWRFEVAEMDARRVARVQVAPEPVEAPLGLPPDASAGAVSVVRS